MMGGSRTFAALLVPGLVSALLAGPALADPKAPASEKDRQTASELVNKAIARGQAGDHLGAVKLYLKAYDIVPNPLLYSNIGAAYQQADRPKDALKYFCMYLADDPRGVNVGYARAQAKLLLRQLGRKKVDPSDICAPPEDPPSEQSEQSEQSDDTEPTTTTPATAKPPTPPSRPPQPPIPVVVKHDSGNSSLMYAGVGAGVTGIVAGGVGIYFGLKAKNVNDIVNGHDPTKPWPNNIRSLMKEGERDNNLQIGFLVASGVLIASGVVLYVVSRPDSAASHETDKTVVHVTPTTNGFAVFGRF